MTIKSKHKLTARQNEWLDKLTACKNSGKSMKVFAASEGLNLQDLYSWKKTLVKKGVLPRSRPPRFEPVEIIDAIIECECRILLPNGVAVVLPVGVGNMSLLNILQNVKQL